MRWRAGIGTRNPEFVDLPQLGASPKRPGRGMTRFFAKLADGLGYMLEADGTETAMGAGGLDLSGLTIERSIQGISDYAAAYDTSAPGTRGMPLGMSTLSRGHTVIQSDCFINTSADIHPGGITSFVSGAGAAISVGTADTNHPGVVQLSTGTTTTGRAVLGNQNTTSIIYAGGGKIRFLVVAKIVALSDGTNTFTVRMGLNTDFTTDGTDSVMFRYSSALNGGEWQGVCRAASAETALDTNVACDTNWHSFEFEINAAASSTEFFIDGASVGTVASNIPTATTTLLPAQINKSAGTTARTMLVDAYQYIAEFTTAR